MTDFPSNTAFNLEPGLIYLNHASVSPWPINTVTAVNAFAKEASETGAMHYDQWLKTETRLREQLARLINAGSAGEIALLKSTSEGLSVIAYGLDLSPGDNVVFAVEEFPSNRIVWESLKRRGVITKQAALSEAADPEQALIDQIDNRTRLLSVSSVQYTSGLKLDLARIGQACKQANVLFCVDAIQHIGALPFDVQTCGADFVVADGHKWMLGPEGVAMFYCRADAMQRLSLNQFGWHMVNNPWDFDRSESWQVATTAARFECGSPNMLGIHALKASLDVLEKIGLYKVEQLVLENTRYLTENLAALENIILMSPLDNNRQSGITAFRHRTVELQPLYQSLIEAGIICAVRGGGIRLSPHFYTTQDELQLVLELVTEFTRK